MVNFIIPTAKVKVRKLSLAGVKPSAIYKFGLNNWDKVFYTYMVGMSNMTKLKFL